VTSAYGMATWQPGGFILGKRRLLLLGKSSINGGLSIAVDCRRVSGLPLSNPLGSSHLDPQLSPQLSVGFLQFKPCLIPFYIENDDADALPLMP
jgi:hypothetical protein